MIKLGPPFPQVQTTVTGKTWVGLFSYVHSVDARMTHAQAFCYRTGEKYKIRIALNGKAHR